MVELLLHQSVIWRNLIYSNSYAEEVESVASDAISPLILVWAIWGLLVHLFCVIKLLYILHGKKEKRANQQCLNINCSGHETGSRVHENILAAIHTAQWKC